MAKSAPANYSAEIQATDIRSPKSQKNESVIIEIPEDLLDSEKWSGCVIFRVPRKLHDLNKKAYTPQLVSIGPFHHDSVELEGMESHKKKYYDKFRGRIHQNRIEELQNFCEEQSIKIRPNYAGTIRVDPKVFGEMILIDACFIFELFIREKEKQGDYILSRPWLRNAIKMDLILLENQLPFTFLDELYSKAEPIHIDEESRTSILNPEHDSASSSTPLLAGHGENQPAGNNGSGRHPSPLLNLTINFFNEYSLGEHDNITEIKHFTDLIRQFWLPERLRSKQIKFKADVNYVYSAKKLDNAGVSFALAVADEEPASSKADKSVSAKADKESASSKADKSVSAKADKESEKASCALADVKIEKHCFNSLKIKLPLLTLEGNTDTLMRNVMALEESLYPRMSFVCHYVALMSELMKTAEDVDFLVEKKIVKNLLGSTQEAADLVNKLCDVITEETFVYEQECKQLNDFHDNWFNKTRAKLAKVYFKDLWTGSSTVVGIFVLIFTITSTIKSLFFS